MFCVKCGARLPDGGNFCQKCGTPAMNAAQPAPPLQAPPAQQQQPYPQQPPTPQAGQISQDTAPMPPVPPMPPPPVQNQQGAWQQPGQVPPSGNKKGLLGSLGIAVLVLLLAGGGFAAYKFGLMDKVKTIEEVSAKTVQEPVEDVKLQGEPQTETKVQIDDPIRANIVSGTMTVASKLDELHTNKVMQLIQGDWYDNSGNKLVTVNDRYINGCEIEAIYDLAGGGGHAAGTFRLKENGQVWDVRLSWNITKTASDSLTVNGNQTLHKSLERGGESVAGVHLGMTPEEVEQKLGKPSQVLSKESPIELGGEKLVAGWYYKDKMFVVHFAGGSVDGIFIPKGSSTHLDKSGLNCENSPEDFARAYSLEKTPPWPSGKYTHIPFPIGNGEYINLGPEMGNLVLTVYAT